MATYKEIQRKYMMKEITKEEYEKAKDRHLRRLFDLYCMDLLTEEEFRKMANS
jgi:hypothetical protein